MADDDLIAAYLTALRRSLRRHADVDDLVCEVDDHLRCATTRLEARGVDAVTAQHEVLTRFGDTRIVALAFAASPIGGTAMPTRLTRTAGTFALIAAVAWLAVAPAAVIGAGAEDWEPHYTTLAVLSFAAAACTTVALLGLLRRPGGGAVTGIALTLAILGTLVLGVVTWMWLVGVGLLTIASVIAALRLRAARLGSAVGGILLAVAWPIGIAIAIALDLAAIGPRDSYGEAFLGQLIGYSSGGIIFAAGLFACGRWLRSEAVVDVSDSMATA